MICPHIATAHLSSDPTQRATGQWTKFSPHPFNGCTTLSIALRPRRQRADLLLLDGPFLRRGQQRQHERKQAARQILQEPAIQQTRVHLGVGRHGARSVGRHGASDQTDGSCVVSVDGVEMASAERWRLVELLVSVQAFLLPHCYTAPARLDGSCQRFLQRWGADRP